MAQESLKQVAEQLQRQVKALTEALVEARNEAAKFKNLQTKPQVEDEIAIANNVKLQVTRLMENFLKDLQDIIDKNLLTVQATPINSHEAILQENVAGGSGAQQFNRKADVDLLLDPRVEREGQRSPASESKVGAESGSQNANATLAKENNPIILHQKPKTLSKGKNVVKPMEEDDIVVSQFRYCSLSPDSPFFVRSGSKSLVPQRLASSAFVGPIEASIHAIPSFDSPNEVDGFSHLSQQEISNPKSPAGPIHAPYIVEELRTLRSRSSGKFRPIKSNLSNLLGGSNLEHKQSKSKHAGKIPRSSRSIGGIVESINRFSGSAGNEDDCQIIAPLAVIKGIFQESKLTAPQLGSVPMNSLGLDKLRNVKNPFASQNETSPAIVTSSRHETPPLVPLESPVQSTNNNLKSASEKVPEINIDVDLNYFISSIKEQGDTSPVSDEQDHGPLIPIKSAKHSFIKTSTSLSPPDFDPFSKLTQDLSHLSQQPNALENPTSQSPPDFDPFSKLTQDLSQQPSALENPTSTITNKKMPLSIPQGMSEEDHAMMIHEQNKAAIEKFISRQPAPVNDNADNIRADYVAATPSFTRELGSDLDPATKKLVVRISGGAEAPVNVNLGSSNQDLPAAIEGQAWQHKGLTWVPTDDGHGGTVWKLRV